MKLITNVEVPVLTEKTLLANYALQTGKDVGSGGAACMTSERMHTNKAPATIARALSLS